MRPLVRPMPAVFFLGAVAVSAWYGGTGPGLLSTVLGTLGAALLLMNGGGRQSSEIGQVLVSGGVSVLICLIITSLRSSRARAERAFAEARFLQLELTAQREAARVKTEEVRQANDQLENLHRKLANQQRQLTNAYETLRRDQQNLTFLLGASTLLSESLDYEHSLATVAKLAVPKMGDACAVDLVDDKDPHSGPLRRLATIHRDPEKQLLLEEMYRRYPPSRDAPHGPPRVMRTGQEELFAHVSDAFLVSIAQDDQHLAMLRELGIKSALTVPFVARGRRLGAISFFSGESDRHFGLSDLNLAKDLARLAAFAIDNAHLFRQVQLADRRKDEFLAMLAHELRNPLAPIMTSFEIMRQRLDDDGGLESIHETVLRQMKHLVRLIDDLVDVSRITRGKVELKREPVEFDNLVRQAVETSMPWIENRRQELKLSFSGQSLWLDADPLRIVQVISNLLNNASKYTPEEGTIWLSSERDGGEVVLRVRDNGAGIDPEMLPHVFDLFTQADRSLDRSQGGLGIGLTLVRSLVEHHRGRVQAFSAGPGLGSEFVIHLPLLDQPIAQQMIALRVPLVEAAAPTVAIRPALRILVVEDSQDTRETLRELLELDGNAVDVAEDGPTGLARVLAERPDVALVDVGLPRLDGYQVASRLREALGQSIVLVALTGYGAPEDRQRAQEAGFDAHLVKPVDLVRLREVLRHPPRATAGGDRPDHV